MPPASERRLTQPLSRMRSTYDEYPGQFWILVVATFIDRLGGALLFPFFTLYITSKFGVGMTQVGVIFAVFSISSVVGSFFGGALTDRLGRKKMLLFGLVVSGLSSLLMGLVNVISLFFAVTLLVGILANTGGPAQQAMVADLLPEEKRIQGYGIIRIVVNLAVTIGPIIGGLLATQSFLLLFIFDALTSLITAVIVYFALRETRPAPTEGEAEESMGQTFRGYLDVLKDSAYTWFLIASALMVVVYMQMNTTLAVYLRDTHDVTIQHFAFILSLNAAMVVLFQFPIAHWISKYRPLVVMAVGTWLYAVGFAMYGLVASYPFFLLAMVIITMGEMFVAPVGQTIVAHLAPEDMRGRYMAVFGFSWVLPTAVGPLLAGLIMDNADPRWVWYAAGILGLIAGGAFYLLEWRVGRSTWAAVDQRLDILERLEEKEISAQEAAGLLEAVEQGNWAKMDAPKPDEESRYLRIRVSDLSSGAMKTDLRLPLGLVNTVLQVGGRLGTDLDSLDSPELRDLISKSTADGSRQETAIDNGDQVEISVE